MFPQRVIFRQCGVIKIVTRTVSHAKLLHHSTRSGISRHREENQNSNLDVFGGIPNYLPCAFRFQSLPPAIGDSPPSDFHARCKSASNDGIFSPMKPMKESSRRSSTAQRPKLCSEMIFDPVRKRFAFLRCEKARHELHDTRVRVQARKRLPVRAEPLP